MIHGNCSVCAGPMLPLFTGTFCPRECDRAVPKEKQISLALEDVLRVIPQAHRARFDRVRGLEHTPWCAYFRDGSGWSVTTEVRSVQARSLLYASEIAISADSNGAVSVVKNRYGECTLEAVAWALAWVLC